ncbi:multiple sugar transport system substrate-binding protein [Enterococcus sp. PF1-24]|uniref:extracellular solute-binding protein n=1 Tax=unclassified Enterococcus TaxID=2608891 RepID=UPI002474210B|nr:MULTISPECIES: extracellular solute-binding protein [unclassified Enterococcus]MDH6364006.1 multiple sugar transport system substrate-binding protein [Enterococcus sp. PFB1-1]MDH6401107.1 multiple sugar transport system substrate-binding protein [Enterococcus sp. PF1-24]
MKKKIFAALFSVLLVGSLAACSSGDDTKEVSGTKDSVADKGMDVIGDAVQFDPNKLVNDGEPIKIDYWTWTENDPVGEMAKEYEKIYPNVEIKFVLQPWDDYWTKLPLSLKGKDSPAIFNIHNSQHDNIFPYLAPYDISVADLEADFTSVAPHVIDDKVYYTDSLINTGNIYYNKEMWAEAGLTDADIPKTWDEFREVAKKLTKTEDGKIVQAGYSYNFENYSAIYEGLNYQKGTLLFKEDGSVANYDNPTTVENMQFLVDLYEKDKVGSKDFGEAGKTFGNGQTAMVYMWGWFLNDLNTNYPDIDYGVFPTPTPTEEVPFAYDRYNGESTPGINKNQSEEQQAVAQDFLRFCLANDEYSKKGALTLASFPTKKSLADDKEILGNPVLSAIAPRVDRLIWPGAFPATVEKTGDQTLDDVLYNGKDLEQAIKDGQAKMESEMKSTDFVSLDSAYEFYDEAGK